MCYVRNVSTSWASATTGLVGGEIFPSDMMAGFLGIIDLVCPESGNRETE